MAVMTQALIDAMKEGIAEAWDRGDLSDEELDQALEFLEGVRPG